MSNTNGPDLKMVLVPCSMY